MGVYYFHFRSRLGRDHPDRVGLELDDDGAAAREAARLSRQLSLCGWRGGSLQVENDAGLVVASRTIGDHLAAGPGSPDQRRPPWAILSRMN